MRFLPDEDHRSYAATVRRLLADAGPYEAARAWAAGDHAPGRALWQALAGTGLPALAVPEERGGIGWYPPELAAAFVEIGRVSAPGPLVETVALAAGLPAASGWTARLLSGDRLATVTDPAAGYAVDAQVADVAFVLEGDGLATGTVAGAPSRSLDPGRHLVRCVPGEAVAADTCRIRALATLLTAAQLLGAGEALLQGSVDYAGQRRQFGRPVGSFQAVKHQLANVAVALEFARPLLYGGALAVRGDTGADPRDLPAAKAACAHAAHLAARTALQVHGALGYTDEYDLTLPLRKARALHGAWGTPAACQAAVLAGELLPG
ncbi:acyl-CoA dehydrogenase family protein [Streptomyces sp. 891-h]|uniref:acyl-CoA dehydrogenase family protein n=1 Tax=Streptomyces sp. 891-h TaxID=2720714 RepID=UPI001FA9B752|nr:acyl-CoA dehydrogenase family protein [Streptomyces sp. 891-h]UNZ17345.1 acyl-CoA/acyl-ACP dehydrogenase [Streptomyces sp. 891-h]